MSEFIYILIACGVWIELDIVKGEGRVELTGRIFFSLCWPFIVGTLLVKCCERLSRE
mgnify:CR=1 FL=1